MWIIRRCIPELRKWVCGVSFFMLTKCPRMTCNENTKISTFRPKGNQLRSEYSRYHFVKIIESQRIDAMCVSAFILRLGILQALKSIKSNRELWTRAYSYLASTPIEQLIIVNEYYITYKHACNVVINTKCITILLLLKSYLPELMLKRF